MTRNSPALAALATLALLPGCLSDAPAGLADARPAATTVAFDWFDQPLPTIPLPNDIATRYDATSPTGRRLNASMLASTSMERRTRTLFDELDGWGVFAPITIPFTGALDVNSIRARHCRFEDGDTLRTFCIFDGDTSDDAVYLIDIDRASPTFGELTHLDVGHGHFPVVVEDINGYWANDPRGWTQSLLFEEEDEDVNGNGVLDPGEDTDLDGVLDKPNYLPGHHPARADLRGRADALMSFYERETHTLILRPMMPLRERTRYAVVVTRRVLDADGAPVGSPFPWINHAAQTHELQPLTDALPPGLALADVAFAFSFTTGTIESDWKAVREGLYGHGIQGHLGVEFPAEVADLFTVRPGADRPYVLYTEEWIEALSLINATFLGGDLNSEENRLLLDSQRFVDFHVIGSYRSPQLFDRVDAEGRPLPLDAQSWPNDLSIRPAPARSEDVTFWLTVPRKEVSARGQGQPAPVVILIHGYGSSRFEALQFGGFFAQYGIATLAIDCVSHGIGLSEAEASQAALIMEGFGLGEFMAATLTGRAFDQNGSGAKDPGADFWTGYLFHTRDVVRQSGLDYLQLIRILRSFDGERRWDLDTNGDGGPNLAGDFDGDGHVDVGLGSTLALAGGSLGGIMSTVVGGIEPAVDVIVAIAGGGGLGDIGIRSLQGGVREAVVLRIMGPVYTGDLDAATGTLALTTVVPNLTRTARVRIGDLQGAQAGDTLYGENLANGVVGCGLVAPDGKVRLHLESDLGDPTRITLYRGLAIVNGSGECELIEGAEPVATLEAFGIEASFQGQTFAVGDPLVALAEGMGRHRARPGLRRMIQLGQIALDRADPAVHAPFLQAAPITYPTTGETTGAHALIITTMGDMNVPASSGVNLARAGGFIDYLEVDPRYGKTPNQVLIDTGTYEAVHTISRYHDPEGRPVHIDLEDFAGGDDIWGAAIPRLDPPLRLVGPDRLCDEGGCGISGALFPFPRPEGQHGFAFPGEQIDRARRICRDACDEEGADPCGCMARDTFDIGSFMFHLLGRYMASGGKQLDFDRCVYRATCDGVPSLPAARAQSELR